MVTPVLRRRGIASHLITAALSLASKELRVNKAVLVTHHAHAGAVSMYAKLGFALTGKQSFLRTW